MTIVYCWLDKSLARTRITAVADSRVSSKGKHGWEILQDETIKLFRVQVKCYSMGSFNCAIGSWDKPYFETELGMAFAGDCFEAMSIVNVFKRTVSQLVVDDGAPIPQPARLYEVLREVMINWFATHRRAEDAIVHFLLFGFSEPDGIPWAGRLVWPHKPELDQFEGPLEDNSLHVIGAYFAAQGKYAGQFGRLMAEKAGKLNMKELKRAGIEPDREEAVLLNGDRMHLEDELAKLLLDDGGKTIGGVMQKIELFRREDGGSVVSFSRDDSKYFESVTEAGPGLSYRSVVELMGTKGRPQELKTFED